MQRSLRVCEQKCIKRLPQRKKVQPGAEAALGNDKQRAWMQRKTGAKLVTVEENVARLLKSIIIREIDVVEISGNRCTLSVEFEVGRLYSGLFHVSYSRGRQWHDLNDVGPLAQISPEIG
ncbi:Uncharacterised protein [Pseudescherichia vulneris]|nr:Uncharacterised protein [Pseudescherichia vulneris]